MVLLQRSTPVWISVDDTYFGQWREATFPWWGSRLKSCAPLKSCNWSLAPLVAESPNPHNTLQLIHHQSQHTRLGSQRLTGSWRLMMQKESPTVQYQWHPVTSSDIQWLSDYSISDGFWCRILFILFGISHSFWFQVAWAGTARIRWFWVSGKLLPTLPTEDKEALPNGSATLFFMCIPRITNSSATLALATRFLP